jgi:hypothetical protein
MDFEKEVEKVADEYRAEGYTVITRPDAAHLPSFAADFSPDLLVTRTDENALVKVKRDRADLQKDLDLPRQLEIVEKQRGWRYDVLVLHGDDPVRRLARKVGEPSLAQTQQMLDEAERVLPSETPRAALVLAWAGLTAAMRRTAQREGLNGKPGTQPVVLLHELYANGPLSLEDFRRLDDVRLVWMAIINGLAPVPVDAGMVQTVVGVARRLLVEGESVPAAAG